MWLIKFPVSIKGINIGTLCTHNSVFPSNSIMWSPEFHFQTKEMHSRHSPLLDTCSGFSWLWNLLLLAVPGGRGLNRLPPTFWVMLSLEPRALYVLGKPCTVVYTLRHFLFLYIICVCVMSKNYLTSRPFIYLKKCLFVYARIRSQRFRQCLTEPGAHQWGSFAGEWAPGLILVRTSPPQPHTKVWHECCRSRLSLLACVVSPWLTKPYPQALKSFFCSAFRLDSLMISSSS